MRLIALYNHLQHRSQRLARRILYPVFNLPLDLLCIVYVAIRDWLHQMGQIRCWVRKKWLILSAGCNNIYYQASRVSFQVINIGDIHIIITLVSVKQVYNRKVKLFNEIEPFRLWFCFHSVLPFSQVLVRIAVAYAYLGVKEKS